VSNLEAHPQETACAGSPDAPAQTLQPREVPLGGPRGLLVRRTLPHRAILTIGPWCFADHYGPVDLGKPDARGMVVPPHPHIGLQTVSWLLRGEVDHRDSVGSVQQVRPGELGLMTAGRGIAHSEYSAPECRELFGIQLWLALTDEHRHREPAFEHHADLPTGDLGDGDVLVFLGEWGGVRSPATAHSPVVGAQLRLPSGTTCVLDLEPSFEHGLLAADGTAETDGEPLQFGELRWLGRGRSRVAVGTQDGATLLLLGGEPLGEPLLMWWNFVGRDHEEIVAARADWEAGRRFGTVVGDDRPPLPAPPLPNARMMPRPNRW
jgi:redox-sensitive bicupin YhaK (pirin superfamily)